MKAVGLERPRNPWLALWLQCLPRGGTWLFKKLVIGELDGGLYQNYSWGVDRTSIRSGLFFDLGIHCIRFGILHFVDSTAPGTVITTRHYTNILIQSCDSLPEISPNWFRQNMYTCFPLFLPRISFFKDELHHRQNSHFQKSALFLWVWRCFAQALWKVWWEYMIERITHQSLLSVHTLISIMQLCIVLMQILVYHH